MTTIEQVKDPGKGESYPRHLLPGCRSACLLFGAGFYGANDGYWVYDAGVQDVVCVDRDEEKLAVMRKMYPLSWQFVCSDWLAFLEACDEQFDLLSVDCPLALVEACADSVPTLLAYAKKVMVLTTRKSLVTEQPGWHLTIRPRTAGICWAVYER